MKKLSKLSILLLFVALAFCACDKNDGDDNGGGVPPNPTHAVGHVYEYSVEVESKVVAPQIQEKIENDLADNPPFHGSKYYRMITKYYSGSLPTTFELQVKNPNGDGWQGDYWLRAAGVLENNDNYQLFPAESGVLAWAKWDVVPVSSEDGKGVATYDAYGQLNTNKMFFCEDLTEKYRKIYPNADIHAVVRRQVLTLVKESDIINE